MAWQIILAKQAARKLERVPEHDRTKIIKALKEMQESPWIGDIAKLRNERTTYRRRIGNYRIFFDIQESNIYIVAIERRTSTTY